MVLYCLLSGRISVMKKSEILTTLINHFFSFDAEKGNQEEYSIDEFIGYLNAKSGTKELEIRKISGENKEWFKDEYRSTTSDISILIVLMNHYAKWYIKKVLRDSHLQTPDEFSFLITLMTYDSLSKSELITKQVMEKTSGTEVIRRLIKRGLIVEYADENDKEKHQSFYNQIRKRGDTQNTSAYEQSDGNCCWKSQC